MVKCECCEYGGIHLCRVYLSPELNLLIRRRMHVGGGVRWCSSRNYHTVHGALCVTYDEMAHECIWRTSFGMNNKVGTWNICAMCALSPKHVPNTADDRKKQVASYHHMNDAQTKK